jgi:alkylated DNA repair dioxygenase AlkB
MAAMDDSPPPDITYAPAFLDQSAATALFETLLAQTAWKEETGVRYGKPWVGKRKVCHYGDPGVVYTYAGMARATEPWPPILRDLKPRVEAATGQVFNYALLNLYRDGRDRLGYHSDSTSGLTSTTIASVSLGAERDFQLKPNMGMAKTKTMKLAHGSLLVMKGNTQETHQHALPPRARVKEPRINITWRAIAMPGN